MASNHNPSSSSHDNADRLKATYMNDGTAILVNLVNLVLDEDTADVQLVVGDITIPTHKIILMASSPYFKKMFLGEWKEAQDSKITLHDHPGCQVVFPFFISFLYCGHISLTVDNVLPILMLSDKYDVPSLRKLCEAYMSGVVEEGDIECALAWFPFADLFSLDVLRGSCITLIACNIEAAAEISTWLLLTIEQLVSILDSSILIVKDEYTLFTVVEKRLLVESAAEVAERTRLVAQHINFKLMTSAQLLQVEQSMIANMAGIDALKTELMEAFRHIALSSDNLKVDRNADEQPSLETRWYSEDLNHWSKFTDYNAPIHIATSSTGRGIHQPQRWIFRLKPLADTHGLSGEVVASREDVFVNSTAQSRQDRYRVQARFAICNSQGIVYWTSEVTIEDTVIPQRASEPLITVVHVCDNKTWSPCRCTTLPRKIMYSVNLKKL